LGIKVPMDFQKVIAGVKTHQIEKFLVSLKDLGT
jgi:hypothetical protein